MAIFRKIHVQFWSDVFIQSLTPEQKFFFLYLLTNDRTKQCGIYETSTRQMSYDTGYNIETIHKLLDFFCRAGKTVFSTSTSEIAIKNWEKYNGSRSPDIKALVNKELKEVKNKKLIEWIQSVDRVLPLSESSLRGEPEPEGDKEQEGEPDKEREPDRYLNSKAADATEKFFQKNSGGCGLSGEEVKKIANEVWKDDFWKEQVCITQRITKTELRQWLAAFNASIIDDEKFKGCTVGRYKKVCAGYIRELMKKGIKVPVQNSQQSSAPPLITLIHKPKKEDDE